MYFIDNKFFHTHSFRPLLWPGPSHLQHVTVFLDLLQSAEEERVQVVGAKNFILTLIWKGISVISFFCRLLIMIFENCSWSLTPGIFHETAKLLSSFYDIDQKKMKYFFLCKKRPSDAAPGNRDTIFFYTSLLRPSIRPHYSIQNVKLETVSEAVDS